MTSPHIASLQRESIDPRTDAALTFVRAIVDKKEKVSDDDFAAVKAAGYSSRTGIGTLMVNKE